jgi:hypothetical protein
MKEGDSVKKVYDEIHAPEALLRKVMEMNKKDFKFRNAVKFVAMAAAALAITVVASNGICYAATGETWIGKMKVLINGVETEQEVTWEQQEDMLVGTIEMEVEEGEPFEMEIVTEEETERLEDTVVIAVVTETEKEEAGE